MFLSRRAYYSGSLTYLEEIVKKLLLVPAIFAMCVSCNGKSNNCDVSKSSNSSVDSYIGINENPQTPPKELTDGEVTKNVKKMLMSDNSLSSSARTISVDTSNGVVTLTGIATNQNEARRVVKMAKGVSGVMSIDNQLKVMYQQRRNTKTYSQCLHPMSDH